MHKVSNFSISKTFFVKDVPPHYKVNHTELHIVATKFGQDDYARYLIQNGVNVNAQSETLNTALHYAVLIGNTSMAILLLQNGARYDIPNINGHTALYIALDIGLRSGNLSLYDILLQM